MTPAAALGELRELQEKVQRFGSALEHVNNAFQLFDIGSEQLMPGQADIGILIPRSAVNNQLADFADEMREMQFILGTLVEVANGNRDELKIETLSSSNLMVYVFASVGGAACIAKAVDAVVGLYKTLLEIRKLQLDIQRLEVPTEISQTLKAHANKVMSDGLEKASVELVNEFYVGKDQGRKNELKIAARFSLNGIANRIDRGYNVEVRIEPPTTPTLALKELWK